MSDIVKVEEVEFDSGMGEAVIGFNIHYTNGDIYPIGPVLLRAELDAIRQEAYERGLRDGVPSAD